MKRLLGLLLVMGMVGCGGGESHEVDPRVESVEKSPDQYLNEDPLVALKKLGAKIERVASESGYADPDGCSLPCRGVVFWSSAAPAG